MAVTGFRKQVVALTVLIATAVVAILVVVSHVLLSRVTDADAHDLARTRAEAVAANVTVKAGRVVLTENSSEALDEVAWVYADRRLVDGNVPPSLVDRVEELADSGRSQVTTVGDYLLYAREVPIDGHRVMVIVRVDLTPYETSEQRSLVLSLVLGGLTVLPPGGVAHLVVRRAMRVVHDMAALADDWGHHEPGRRFNLGVPRDEFGELGRTLDHLLECVDNALLDERRLTDEIAHELRTPLTVLRAEAQLAQISGEPVPPEAVLNEVDRLDAAITTLLRAARARTGEGTRCDLGTAARRRSPAARSRSPSPGRSRSPCRPTSWCRSCPPCWRTACGMRARACGSPRVTRTTRSWSMSWTTAPGSIPRRSTGSSKRV
jgi:hypothetical protein